MGGVVVGEPGHAGEIPPLEKTSWPRILAFYYSQWLGEIWIASDMGIVAFDSMEYHRL